MNSKMVQRDRMILKSLKVIHMIADSNSPHESDLYNVVYDRIV